MEEKFETAFPDPKQKIEKPVSFQSAFEVETQPEPDKPLCRYGCGKPGQYFGEGPRAGELPRCSKQMSDCPVVGGAARRAARRRRF